MKLSERTAWQVSICALDEERVAGWIDDVILWR